MRFYLSLLLVFLCVFATAQVPPMVIGGPQGIDVTRILSRNWMAIPIMTDTPVAPLTGAGWPGRGYIVHVAKANDTTVWHYTGNKWQRIGGVAENKYTALISGGKFSRNASLNRFTVGSSTYYIDGQYYSSGITQLNGFTKNPNANGRIDIVALGTTGPVIIQGTESLNPVSPIVAANRIKLGFVYYPPFDTLPVVSGNGIEAIFRKPGVDSIFFSTSDTTLSIMDSIGIAAGDTATMLNPYKFTAANGLTKDSTVFRLGGSLNQNTNINLNTRRLTFIGGTDTIRFFANGRVSIGGTPDSTYRLFINNGGIRTDSLIVNDLYSKFGRYIGDGSVPFAPIEFRATSGNRMRIDLRPASNGGWNSNWYGAITHNGPETDILYSNYGTLYLGSSWFTAGGGIYIGGTRSQPAVRVLNNSNVLIGDTANTGFRLDVNGTSRFRSSSYFSDGRIFYGPSSSDTALVMKNTQSNTASPGISIGNNSTPIFRRSYIFGDRNIITGASPYEGGFLNSIFGNENNVDSSGSIIVAGNGNNVPNPSTHQIILGNSNISNSYTNFQNASIVIGLGNNTNNFWGNGLIGSGLKYYENGQLAFGANSPSVNFATRNVYFGNGVKNEHNNINANFGHGPDVAINPSWANDVDSTNRRGGSLTLAGGRGTGTGAPGAVIFSTWKDTISGILFHPRLLERARISERGNLLVGTATDDTSSLVNIVSTTKGFLQPRMTNTQRDAIATPATGLQLFSTTDSANYVYRGAGGGWQKIANEISGSATLDFPSTNNGNESDLTITVTGASEGDVVSLGISNSVNLNHSCFTAWVSATNTVTVRFNNYGTGALNPVSATFKVKVFK